MIHSKRFGTLQNGDVVQSYTLINRFGMKVEVLNYGGIIKEICVPNRQGVLKNVVLSYDDLSEYVNDSLYLGATIGRTAGRIENATIDIDGVEYKLDKNNGANTLHGGYEGFNKKIMKSRCKETEKYSMLELDFTSYDGECGFPGTLDVKIEYYLMKEDNTLEINMKAKSNKKTYINMTNHTYFNLSNIIEDTISKHGLELNANEYAPVSEDMIPRYGWKSVRGTKFDFTIPKLLSDVIKNCNNEGFGVDNPFKIVSNNKYSKALLASRLIDENSGRFMEVYTNQPHMVIYTGNFLDTPNMKDTVKFKKHNGICFEAQEVPNAQGFLGYDCKYINPEDEYINKIIYRFKVK